MLCDLVFRAGSNYTNSNYRDENYHDYMNADALSSPSGPSPLFQAGQPSPPSTQQAETNTQQDQRLLSVSGKKKCSHCSEELGEEKILLLFLNEEVHQSRHSTFSIRMEIKGEPQHTPVG